MHFMACQQKLSSAEALFILWGGGGAWVSKNEALRRENCTVYAKNGQLCNKDRREALYPQNPTVPRLQMLSVWQKQLYNKQFC